MKIILEDEIKIDPVTPDNFYNTPIDDMGEKIIDEWFNVPYIQTRGEHFAVMCLDGGAWDRPTVKGFFDSVNNAKEFILENYSNV